MWRAGSPNKTTVMFLQVFLLLAVHNCEFMVTPSYLMNILKCSLVAYTIINIYRMALMCFRCYLFPPTPRLHLANNEYIFFFSMHMKRLKSHFSHFDKNVSGPFSLNEIILGLIDCFQSVSLTILIHNV